MSFSLYLINLSSIVKLFYSLNHCVLYSWNQLVLSTEDFKYVIYAC